MSGYNGSLRIWCAEIACSARASHWWEGLRVANASTGQFLPAAGAAAHRCLDGAEETGRCGEVEPAVETARLLADALNLAGSGAGGIRAGGAVGEHGGWFAREDKPTRLWPGRVYPHAGPARLSHSPVARTSCERNESESS